MFTVDVAQNGADVDVTLAGRLDGVSAPQFNESMAPLLGQKIDILTFHVKDLEYISSAGLRVIVFVKQKLGPNTRMRLQDVQPTVRSVLDMTGFSNFFEGL